MSSLTLTGIRKTYGPLVVLDDINLRVENGSFCVLLGPSGCGKSTLLQIVAGLTQADRGTVCFDEQPVDHLPPRKRDIAMVFQNYALYPHMTVRENLAFGLRLRGFARADIARRVNDTAQMLAIGHLLDQRPRQLSGGQRQRVAMGRALVREPRLFLLDEPLSNLDAQLRAGVRLELKELHRRLAATFVYVTHDQTEAMTLGDQVVILHQGRIRQIGPPAAIYRAPADPFVAGFIGSPPMNLLAGTLKRDGNTPIFTITAAGIRLSLAGLPADTRTGLVEGSDIILGIRPEHVGIKATNDATSNKIRLTGRTAMITDVGADRFAHLDLGGGLPPFTVRLPAGFSVHPGGQLHLWLPPEHLHLFRDTAHGRGS
jgi:ABC-type sugar transport system ATPase subunit